MDCITSWLNQLKVFMRVINVLLESGEERVSGLTVSVILIKIRVNVEQDPLRVNLGTEKLEKMNAFMYLGLMISADGGRIGT